MDLDFGHGFLPRIGEENYKAVDRCLAPADLFDPEPIDLPWATVDCAWIEGHTDMLGALRQHGTKIIADTSGWRFRYDATANVVKLRDASWSPASPLSVTDANGGRQFVEASLRAQAAVGADAYLVPGWMPEETEDLAGPYEQIFETVASFDDVPGRPLILFVGGHTRAAERTLALLDAVPHFISGIYLQMSPISPVTDSPAKLETITAVYRHAASRGFSVIAGHAGAVAPALRSLGVDAADAGLATSETFDKGRAKTIRRNGDGDDSGGGPGARMYFSEIGRSLSAREINRLLAVPGAAAELRTCRLPCHRFRSGDLLNQSREHSLWARVADAQMVVSLPASMRATSVYERLRTRRSTLATINGALAAGGEAPLDVKPLENHMAWIARALVTTHAA